VTTVGLLQMKVCALRDESKGLQPEIQNAVEAGDAEGRDAALRRKQTLVVEIQRLVAEMKAENARRPEVVGPPASIADLRARASVVVRPDPALRAEIVAHLRAREAAWTAFVADGGANEKPQ